MYYILIYICIVITLINIINQFKSKAMKTTMRRIHHITDSKTSCSICGEPFKMYWFDKEEKNGHSERMYGLNEDHKNCLESQTGHIIKSLQELNEERKYQ